MGEPYRESLSYKRWICLEDKLPNYNGLKWALLSVRYLTDAHDQCIFWT